MRRRDFLLTSLAGLAIPGLRQAGRFDRIERLGIQLYTVRELFRADPEGTLRALADAGYREVEFAGYVGRTPAQVRRMLDAAGLEAPSAHIDLDAIEKQWEGTLAAAREIGHRYLVLAWIPAANRASLATYRAVGALLNRAGEAAARHGIRVAYHNHDFEFAPLDGGVGYDALIASLDPALVSLELDLYWMTKAGRQPLDYFARLPGRFPMVHVKDMGPKGEMRDVGAGTIDFAAIFRQREQAGIKHFFVEHDEPGDALASARASAKYLTALRF
ncbi:MAG: sugar phosphate isomerase/epimerase [Gemmatimonadales bacterium]